MIFFEGHKMVYGLFEVKRYDALVAAVAAHGKSAEDAVFWEDRAI